MRNGNTKYRIAVMVLSLLLAAESAALVSLWLARPKKQAAVRPKPKAGQKPKPAAAVKGRIAIVLDDWGYNLNNVALVKEIPYPLTIAVLPGLPYSSAVSEALHKEGFEIILHLPMEPREKYRLEHDTIMTGMDEARMKGIFEKSLASVPCARGVSNHMGSRATEDNKTMTVVCDELRERGLYFLDSLVTSGSVGFTLSRRAGIPAARRDIFLDNMQDPAYIASQMRKLQKKAALYGSAVGIGHDRKTTLKTLRQEMPRMEQEGYRFVFVSELAD